MISLSRAILSGLFLPSIVLRSLSSASSNVLSPVISAKYMDMSSNERPFVSGKNFQKKRQILKQTNARTRKKPPQVKMFAVVKNVEVTNVAVTLFKNVAMLIALARMVVENTSLGISHAPGPIPRLKNERYIANPTRAKIGCESSMKNAIAIIVRETAIPSRYN